MAAEEQQERRASPEPGPVENTPTPTPTLTHTHTQMHTPAAPTTTPAITTTSISTSDSSSTNVPIDPINNPIPIPSPPVLEQQQQQQHQVTDAAPESEPELAPAPAHNAPIPVEEWDPDVDDSAYGDDVLSDTTSIPSTIYRHRYENGRRYAKFREGEYWGPNDEQQNDQLDIAHHMFLILLDNKLYLAPVVNPKKCLDLGCGTGIWAIDFADENPQCEVLGVDFSPIQPSFAPPNCKFEVDDVTSPWTYPPNSFDFINIRTLYGAIADWPALYRQIYDHLAPGGWLNQLELTIQFKSDDGSLLPDHVFSQWSEIFLGAGEKFGKSFRCAHHLKRWLGETGFDDVHEYWYKLPVGHWSSDPRMKEVGKWNLLHCNQGAEGWGLFLLTRILDWTKDEAMVFIAKFRQALRDRHVHAYLEVVVVYGRKPQSYST